MIIGPSNWVVTLTGKKIPTARQPTSLSGNSAKVLARLLDMLNPDHFVKINRAAVGAEIGLPKGSIGASIAKLLDTGHLIEGGIGEYKLGTPKTK